MINLGQAESFSKARGEASPTKSMAATTWNRMEWMPERQPIVLATSCLCIWDPGKRKNSA